MPDLSTFKRDLQAMCKERGFTVRSLAETIQCPAASVGRAWSGPALPSRELITAIAEACSQDPEPWIARLDALAREKTPRTSRRAASGGGGDASRFIAALDAQRLSDGGKTFRLIAERADLPPRKVNDVFREEAGLPDWADVERVLPVIGVRSEEVATWLDSYKLARDGARSTGGQEGKEELLRQLEANGLEGLYPNREWGMQVMLRHIKRDTRPGGRLWIVGSSMRGWPWARLVVDAIEHRVDVRIVLTDPEKLDDRAKQERRPYGSIADEMLISIRDLRLDDKIKRTHVRLLKAAPTVFGICTSDRMLLNPYPYGQEAYRSWTEIYARNSKGEGIFADYEQAHFQRAWLGSEEIDIGLWSDADPVKRSPDTGARSV